MPLATPGFVGARLREAREARGIRAVQLAEMLDISPQAVSSYEKGAKTPSPTVAEAISTQLNMPPRFFTRPAVSLPERAVFYRSMSAATKQSRTRAEWRLRWLETLTEHVSSSIEFPEINLPDFDVTSNLSQIADQDIEHIAEQTRRFWGMSDGPIGNMVYLLENQGVIVARDELGGVTLDSLSVLSDRPYVMIGTEKGTAVRWRYDAAHELGHLLLHSRVNAKSLRTPQEFKVLEKQAHRFAAAFLLPMSAFANDFFSASLDNLRAIKPHWRVSIAMMIMRARDGGLITEEHQRRMFINYHRRKWQGAEPLDDTLEAEEPALMRKAIELVLAHGAQSGAELAENVALSPSDIESLCGLQNGFLTVTDEPSVSLRQDMEAEVFQFQARERRSHHP